jgi:hypothetical protein
MEIREKAMRSHGKREVDGGDGRSPRADRIAQYENPQHPSNWRGQATQQNLDRWSARASQNSQCAPRAASGPADLHSTKIKLHDTSAPPRSRPDVDERMTDGGARPRYLDE